MDGDNQVCVITVETEDAVIENIWKYFGYQDQNWVTVNVCEISLRIYAGKIVKCHIIVCAPILQDASHITISMEVF